LRQHRRRRHEAASVQSFPNRTPRHIGHADGADDISWVRADPDDPVAGVALAAECDLDSERPQECLGTPQPTGQRPRVAGPPGRFYAYPRRPSWATICEHAQQLGGTASPRAAHGHELAQRCRKRVGINGIFDSKLAVRSIATPSR